MLHEMFSTLGSGKMVRLVYETELPIKAKYKKLGVKIIKHTETTVRCGVEYSNIGSVVAKRNSSDYITTSRNYTNHFEWIVTNVIKYNTQTDKYYVSCATLPKGSNTKISYSMIDQEGKTFENIQNFNREYVIDSYFKSNDRPAILIINTQNIISINGVNVR